MKIAYLVNQYPMASLTFIRREIHALEAMGHEVLRFALQPWPEQLVDELDRREAQQTRYAKAAGIPALGVQCLKVAILHPHRFYNACRLSWQVSRRSDRSFFRHLAYLAEACVIVEWVQREGAQHVHAHFASNSAEVVMLMRALGGPPYSFMVHGPEDFDRAVCLSLALKAAHAAFVTTISSFARSQIFRWIRVSDWRKVAIVRCGLDSDLLESEIEDVPDAPRLVNIGRLNEQKGQLVLVEAAAIVADAGWTFELNIVGDGEMRPLLEEAIARHGLQKYVHLRGWATNERVREMLRDSRALILASFAEGLPVVIMEAFAVGRPVISTRIAGVPELVEHGTSGWLVPPGDARALAASMITALQAPVELLGEMGKVGRSAVLEEHDAAKEATRLAKLISRVVESRGSSCRDAEDGSVSSTKLDSNVNIL